jgi:3-oxoacyl-[acyl-carrier-protein] synthase II
MQLELRGPRRVKMSDTHIPILPTTGARVAVVGLGVVSPLGFGSPETLAALRAGKDCVSPVSRFSVDQCRSTSAGQICDKRLNERNKGAIRPERIHRVAQMLVLALGEALAQSPRFEPELSVVGTTSGGMSFGEEYYRKVKKKQSSLRRIPTLIANYTPQKAIIDAQTVFGLTAPCQVIANACASGANAIGHAFECIRSGRYRRILAGGYDAISELVFVGFDSLQASTPERCRPFDRDRTGLVLGEGAAVLFLENLELANAEGKEILAEIIGYGMSTDNHHLTQPEPSGIGPRHAMEAALRSANVESDEVDYINAHGTATRYNDSAEAKAIATLFGRVPVSSTKSMMGHALGAAGAIEIVVSVLALQNHFLPPNINFRSGDPELDINVVTAATAQPSLRTVLSNSFGFGGTNASVIIRAPER